MFYYYFRLFALISNVFGLRRPFFSPLKNNVFCSGTLWSKVCSVIIIIFTVLHYFITGMKFNFDLKKNLDKILKLNEVTINVAIVLIELINKDEMCLKLYETMNNCLERFKISNRNLRMIAIKMYLWFLVPTLSFTLVIIWEIYQLDPPFILILKIPIFLIFSHLVIHLYLILSILRIINYNLSKMFMFGDKLKVNQHSDVKGSIVRYLFNFNRSFIEDNHLHSQQRYDIKFLCRVYDDINTCMKLLEKIHGLQILLSTWLKFSSTVAGVTLVTCKLAQNPYLIFINSILPFLWCLFGCFVEDQLRKEVEKTENLIIKHLIDFRCDQPRKNMLQSFKQLVSTQRLQLTAYDLFDLNYSMVLGTVVNVITYSIILIQLLMS